MAEISSRTVDDNLLAPLISRRLRLGLIGQRLALAAAIIGIWWLSSLSVPHYILPGPARVWDALRLIERNGDLWNLASVADEWKKLTKGNAPPILAVTIVYNDYLAKNAEAVAKFIVATRNALQYGSNNKPQVAETLQKAANTNAADARAYASQWDGAYIASFEPADIASLKRMYDIVKAAVAPPRTHPGAPLTTDPTHGQNR